MTSTASPQHNPHQYTPKVSAPNSIIISKKYKMGKGQKYISLDAYSESAIRNTLTAERRDADDLSMVARRHLRSD